MNIVLFDNEKYTPNSLQELIDYIKETDKKTKWLFLPKDFNLLLNCSIDQLYIAKKIIDESINEKKGENKWN